MPALVSVMAVLVTTVFAGVGIGQLSDTFTNWLDHPAIAYKSTRPADPVAELDHNIQEGHLQLNFEGESGYLPSVLEALRVPVESQIAVFVKDSVQRARISPSNPRTLFFNESVAVGWVRGGFIELAAQDPLHLDRAGRGPFKALLKQDDRPIPLADAAKEIVDYLLFLNEAPLAGDIHGSSEFAERFEAQGPHDRQGRSLRELDLHRRLMRYPCS